MRSKKAEISFVVAFAVVLAICAVVIQHTANGSQNSEITESEVVTEKVKVEQNLSYSTQSSHMSDEAIAKETELTELSEDITEGDVEEDPRETCFWMYVDCDSLNVREQPDSDSAILGEYKYRDLIYCTLAYSEDWYEVIWDDFNTDTEMLGYVRAKYLIEEEPPIPMYQIIENGETYILAEELQEFTYHTCIEYDILDHYELILAQMFVETHYVEGLVSATHDHGLMQINESNNSWLSKKLGFTDFDNSENSIIAGVYLMSEYLKEFTVSQALSKYNTGKPYNSTKYSRHVLNCLDKLERIN